MGSYLNLGAKCLYTLKGIHSLQIGRYRNGRIRDKRNQGNQVWK